MAAKKSLSSQETKKLLATLKSRFEKNSHRHKDLSWAAVEKKLLAAGEKLLVLNELEKTGGEPDVVSLDADGHGKGTGEYIFYDCSAESPKGRRSYCYDRAAWESRKEAKPKNNAVGAAAAMGAEIITEEQYRQLQHLEPFDMKTSSWIATPDRVRKLGGALFCDRRFDTVFTYHNGAESYYAARGFRCWVRV
jgi:Protein of unknown function (DUF4256)